MSWDFAGRRIVITGGAGYIGSELARALGSGGARVAILDRDEGRATAVATRISHELARPDAVVAVACNLLDATETLAAVDDAVRRLGGLDGLVHNAGFVGTSDLEGWTVPFGDQAAQTWRDCLEINLTVPFYLTQHVLEPLRQSDHSAVLMIGSIYGVVGPDQRLYDETPMGANPAGYGASKGGLVQLTRYLSTTMAPQVRVNCLSPGGLFRNQPKEFVSRYVSRTPLARMATEADIVGPAAFLLSREAAYITGHNLMVDGGWTAW